MTVMEAARQLGVCIQEDERYKVYNDAQKAVDQDEKVKELGENLQELQNQYEAEAVKAEPDQAAMDKIRSEYEELYRTVYQVPSMVAVMDAKEGMDAMMNEVMNLLYMVIGGADPETVQVTPETMQQMQQQMMQM